MIPRDLLEELESVRKNKKLVFTNGCFDILHKGHVQYLNQAKECGDILVIGLNSDMSVRKLKGEGRPVNSELDRKFVLENLKAVDFVFIFPQDTPVELLHIIKPNIFVKGGDYNMEEIPETPVVRSYGGEVRALQFVDGYSTTNTIEKMKS